MTSQNFTTNWKNTFLLQSYVSAPAPAYKFVKTGTTCNRVTTYEECEQAVQELGLVNTHDGNGRGFEHSASSRIPYCWYSHDPNEQRTLFNTYTVEPACKSH